MQNPYDVLIRPVISERSLELHEDNKYTFIVDPRANKSEIKDAVEEVFNVKVDKVWTMRTHGKVRRQGRTSGRTPDRKKAIVALKPGSRIELFEDL